MLDCIELNPGQGVEHSIIWLHGLGADGNDFVPVAGQLQLPVPVRYIFPNAPVRPVTINGGMAMRAWYDIKGENGDSLDDVLASVAEVRALLEREIERGTPAERIVLAGFSQGGVIAQHLAFRYPDAVAGVLALSTYLPHFAESLPQFSPASRQVPILYMHGTQDPMIPMHRARSSFNALSGEGYQFEWKEYDMPHAVCPEQIKDIEAWLQARFKPSVIARPS